MGFEKSKAEKALDENNNEFDRAMEVLLHQKEIEEMEKSKPDKPFEKLNEEIKKFIIDKQDFSAVLC